VPAKPWIPRRDPRAVQAEVLNRAVEGGAFDGILTRDPMVWPGPYGAWREELVKKATELVGPFLGEIAFYRTWNDGRPIVRFSIDGFDGR